MAHFTKAILSMTAAAFLAAAWPGTALAVQQVSAHADDVIEEGPVGEFGPPDPITEFTAVLSAGDPTQVELSWVVPAAPEDLPITAFILRYSTGGPILTPADWADAALLYEGIPDRSSLAAGSIQTWTSDSLAAGTYHFSICSRNGGGVSDISTVSPSVTVGSAVLPTVATVAVVAGSATTSTLQVTWSDLSVNAAEVRIFYSTDPEAAPNTAVTEWIPATPGEVTVTLPASGTTYYFGGMARTVEGQPGPMSEGPYASGTTLTPGGPSTPAGGSESGSDCGLSAAGAGFLPALLAALLLSRRVR